MPIVVMFMVDAPARSGGWFAPPLWHSDAVYGWGRPSHRLRRQTALRGKIIYENDITELTENCLPKRDSSNPTECIHGAFPLEVCRVEMPPGLPGLSTEGAPGSDLRRQPRSFDL